MNYKYCNNLFSYSRFLTREVNVGGIKMGGHNPIRLQSMTNTKTLDTISTVDQCIRIINAGADYVRITAQGVREAENLAEIKSELRKQGYKFPLVADVHFNSQIAEIAAAIVEKVRINPGNYSDKKRFEKIDFTDNEYKIELEKIAEKLQSLFKICRKNGTALRIGVNHGSLSDRVMSRYGDTPEGMVESAMEFLRICAVENFHNVVASLKSSNTLVMIQANRLLLNRMITEGMNYPLHLGVTEAGEGEVGRIKSSAGIGSLLADGIGDTIRVSLTEDPENEIPVARELVNNFKDRNESYEIPEVKDVIVNPFSFQRRETIAIENIGGKNLPVVLADWQDGLNETSVHVLLPEYFYLSTRSDFSELPGKFRYILNMHDWFKYAKTSKNIFPLLTLQQFEVYGAKHPGLNFVIASNMDDLRELQMPLKDSRNVVLIFETFNKNGIADQRSLFYQMLEKGIKIPAIINRNYSENSLQSFQLKASSDIGALLVDGFSDGIWIRNAGTLEPIDLVSTSFDILQSGRVRTSKTEYISCPSCGRTLFDLQSVTTGIKKRTNHLKNLKIAIMGCIVNGPGEMADADYGFIGSGIGKISLYKGKQIIKKNIPSANAIDELVSLIKESGDWREP